MQTFVKTSRKELEFNLQGRHVTHTEAIQVNKDHNVLCHLKDGSLVEVSNPFETENKPKHKKESKKIDIQEESNNE
jgi:hypothetical protein